MKTVDITKPDCLAEEDIRPQSVMADKLKYVETDRQFLLDRSEDWADVSCPACDSVQYSAFGEKNGFRYRLCTECRTVYTSPRPNPSLMSQFYASSLNYQYWNQHVFPRTEAARRLSIVKPRADIIEAKVREYSDKRGTLIDIGAGFGTFCEEMRSRMLFERIVAIEPSQELAMTCRAKGIEVWEANMESLQAGETATTVTAFEVIEHVYSPQHFVLQCKELLLPGGLLFLSCPNVYGFDLMTIGTLSNTFDHEHVNYFNCDSLPYLLGKCGFSVLNVQTPGKLDAELVRKQVLNGSFDLSSQPFLLKVLVERWEELGIAFQEFLARNKLSSHMLITASKI